MPARKKTADFESSLKRLEDIVRQMEQGDMPIEDALKYFEEGVSLTRDCQQTLDKAEQKVKVLVESRGEIKERDLNADENS